MLVEQVIRRERRLHFSGGGGSGATGTINVSSGVITSVSITSQGIGYTSAPTVSVSGGTGASLTAVIETPDALDRAATFGTGFTDAWDSTKQTLEDHGCEFDSEYLEYQVYQ